MNYETVLGETLNGLLAFGKETTVKIGTKENSLITVSFPQIGSYVPRRVFYALGIGLLARS